MIFLQTVLFALAVAANAGPKRWSDPIDMELIIQNNMNCQALPAMTLADIPTSVTPTCKVNDGGVWKLPDACKWPREDDLASYALADVVSLIATQLCHPPANLRLPNAHLTADYSPECPQLAIPFEHNSGFFDNSCMYIFDFGSDWHLILFVPPRSMFPFREEEHCFGAFDDMKRCMGEINWSGYASLEVTELEKETNKLFRSSGYAYTMELEKFNPLVGYASDSEVEGAR